MAELWRFRIRRESGAFFHIMGRVEAYLAQNSKVECKIRKLNAKFICKCDHKWLGMMNSIVIDYFSFFFEFFFAPFSDSRIERLSSCVQPCGGQIHTHKQACHGMPQNVRSTKVESRWRGKNEELY